jgi:pentatricopeptide repeat protein
VIIVSIFIRTYDLLLSACCKAKKFHLAKELIENTIIPNSHLFLPDIVLCNSMLRVASRFDRQTLQNIIEIMKRENVTFGNVTLIHTHTHREREREKMKMNMNEISISI